jgi:phosphatidylserine/phosphatidylglycerophosphate/cardiolipin synthase-like enzyme
MRAVLAVLAIVGLMAAVAIVANMPSPAPDSDRPLSERHEKVSIAAIAALPTFTAVVALDVREIEQAIAKEYAAAHGRYVGGLAAQAAIVPATRPEIHYAPEERLDQIDLSLIENAGTSIDMAAYVLSDWAIIDALNDAEARGVKVRVILDPREHSDVSRLAGLDVRQKRPGAIQHLKAYEIDGQILRTGSENFSHSAPSQDNDLVVIQDPTAVVKFDTHFAQMWTAAVPINATATRPGSTLERIAKRFEFGWWKR